MKGDDEISVTRPIMQAVRMEDGQAWVAGKECSSCNRERHPMFTGMRVRQYPSGWHCAFCQAPVPEGSEALMPDKDGWVTLKVVLDGTLHTNPFLNPLGSMWGDRVASGDLEKDWVEAGCTDMANGQRLVDLHGDKFRFVPPFKSFIVYDGFKWRLDEVCAVERYAKNTVQSMIGLAGQIPFNSEAGKRFQDHAQSSASKGKMDAMMHMARSHPRITLHPDQLDQAKHLLNTPSGPVDLINSGTLRADPLDYFTRTTSCEFNPDAQCPTWDAFLKTMCCGDLELVAWLQKAVGYTLTGETTEQCFFFLFGDGSNGKSTFLETLREILADYATALSFELFLRGTRMNTDHGLAALRGVRMAVASEAPEGKSWNEELIKNITGGEAIRARLLYQNAFEFVPQVKIWFGANDKPRIHSVNESMWRRLIPIPCRAHIKPEDRDLRLPEKLWAEREGILAWAVRGAELWHLEGLRPLPAIVRQTLEEYRTESDTFARFLEEKCEIQEPEDQFDRPMTISSTILLKHYNEWAKITGERPLTAVALATRMGKHRGGIFRKSRDNTGRAQWEGLRLANHPLEDEPEDPFGRYDS